MCWEESWTYSIAELLFMISNLSDSAIICLWRIRSMPSYPCVRMNTEEIYQITMHKWIRYFSFQTISFLGTYKEHIVTVQSVWNLERDLLLGGNTKHSDPLQMAVRICFGCLHNSRLPFKWMEIKSYKERVMIFNRPSKGYNLPSESVLFWNEIKLTLGKLVCSHTNKKRWVKLHVSWHSANEKTACMKRTITWHRST